MIFKTPVYCFQFVSCMFELLQNFLFEKQALIGLLKVFGTQIYRHNFYKFKMIYFDIIFMYVYPKLLYSPDFRNFSN